MKKLKNKELIYECFNLQLKGKCAVLLNSNNNDYTCDKVLLKSTFISNGITSKNTVFDNLDFKQIDGMLINFFTVSM